MSKGGGSSTQTVTQVADPWKGVQPTLKAGLSDLSKWYTSSAGRNYYPGSTVVPFSNQTKQALTMTQNRAINGSPVMNSANRNLQDTLDGKYLAPGSNPWLQSTYDLAAGNERSQLDSQFNQGGAYGGSLHEGARAAQLADLGTQIFGGNYSDERNRQMQAMLFAPQAAASDYADAQALGQVGSAYEGQAGKELADNMARYDFGQQNGLDRIKQLLGIASGLGTPNSTTQTSPTNTGSGATNVLGGLSSLAGIGNALGLFGTAAGAGAGLAGGAGTLIAALSDPAEKENIDPVNDNILLQMFKEVPGFTYDYHKRNGEAFAGRKIGPMADQFAKVFGGNDPKLIPMPKMLGALWAAIPALTNKIERLEAKVA